MALLLQILLVLLHLAEMSLAFQVMAHLAPVLHVRPLGRRCGRTRHAVCRVCHIHTRQQVVLREPRGAKHLIQSRCGGEVAPNTPAESKYRGRHVPTPNHQAVDGFVTTRILVLHVVGHPVRMCVSVCVGSRVFTHVRHDFFLSKSFLTKPKSKKNPIRKI